MDGTIGPADDSARVAANSNVNPGIEDLPSLMSAWGSDIAEHHHCLKAMFASRGGVTKRSTPEARDNQPSVSSATVFFTSLGSRHARKGWVKKAPLFVCDRKPPHRPTFSLLALLLRICLFDPEKGRAVSQSLVRGSDTERGAALHMAPWVIAGMCYEDMIARLHGRYCKLDDRWARMRMAMFVSTPWWPMRPFISQAESGRGGGCPVERQRAASELSKI